MNATQYAQYEAAVVSFLERNKVKPGCCSPVGGQSDSNEVETPCEAEPFFSWQPCGCCQSPLGGNRETYQFAVEASADWPGFEADICADCVYYLAYGQLDDMTMLEIEASVNPAPTPSVRFDESQSSVSGDNY